MGMVHFHILTVVWLKSEDHD